MASTTGSSGAAVADQAQDALKEGAEMAREQAANVKDQAQSAAQDAQRRAREQVEQRTTDAGHALKGHAGDARSMAEQLRSQGKDGPARLVEEAASHAESLGGYLSEADAERMIRDVERYARQNPWAVIVGGLALGFAASRMVSAASAGRQDLPSGGSDRARLGAGGPPAPAADAPRAAADAAIGSPYEAAAGNVPATADLPNYGGSPS